MIRKFLRTVLIVFIFSVLLLIPARAEEADYKATTWTTKSFSDAEVLFDSNRATYKTVKENGYITMQNPDGIAHLYIEFDRLPPEWLLKAGDHTITCGQKGFLHEYIDLVAVYGKAPTAVSIKFPMGTVIADVYAFTEGDLPDWVQKWDVPCEKADLMLLSSHSDDEQLFFAGVLPYYAIERKMEVQVVYIVQHFEANGIKDHTRPHEQLDGLWKVGVRHYPVMSTFPDVYSESKNRDVAFKQAEKAFGAAGVTYDDFKSYITECLRRFKPLVVVSHDLNGEYGHGTHVFCASALTEAIHLAADKTQYPQSANRYGTWQVEKTYLHLYEENPITMDWDTPLESLGGKSPFQVTQEGFGCHKSQHWTWFKRWIYGNNNQITKATQIDTYSPCRYGLYDTKVGPDQAGGDFMENVLTHAEREELDRQEAKAERERQEAEQKAKFEAEAAAQKAKYRKVAFFGLCGCAVLVLIAGVIALVRRRRFKLEDEEEL
ncbi:MAG: PIG-L family deacetylase [Clostridia bacterium]|nr:PIG-L family deacetylase [Clostridia bacterium]